MVFPNLSAAYDVTTVMKSHGNYFASYYVAYTPVAYTLNGSQAVYDLFGDSYSCSNRYRTRKLHRYHTLVHTHAAIGAQIRQIIYLVDLPSGGDPFLTISPRKDLRAFWASSSSSADIDSKAYSYYRRCARRVSGLDLTVAQLNSADYPKYWLQSVYCSHLRQPQMLMQPTYFSPSQPVNKAYVEGFIGSFVFRLGEHIICCSIEALFIYYFYIAASILWKDKIVIYGSKMQRDFYFHFQIINRIACETPGSSSSYECQVDVMNSTVNPPTQQNLWPQLPQITELR